MEDPKNPKFDLSTLQQERGSQPKRHTSLYKAEYYKRPNAMTYDIETGKFKPADEKKQLEEKYLYDFRKGVFTKSLSLEV